MFLSILSVYRSNCNSCQSHRCLVWTARFTQGLKFCNVRQILYVWLMDNYEVQYTTPKRCVGRVYPLMLMLHVKNSETTPRRNSQCHTAYHKLHDCWPWVYRGIDQTEWERKSTVIFQLQSLRSGPLNSAMWSYQFPLVSNNWFLCSVFSRPVADN